MTPDEAGLVFTMPSAYADDDRFHRACTVLRRDDPVHLVHQSDDFAPFWAIIKHAAILEIEAKPELFTERAADSHSVRRRPQAPADRLLARVVRST